MKRSWLKGSGWLTQGGWQLAAPLFRGIAGAGVGVQIVTPLRLGEPACYAASSGAPGFYLHAEGKLVIAATIKEYLMVRQARGHCLNRSVIAVVAGYATTRRSASIAKRCFVVPVTSACGAGSVLTYSLITAADNETGGEDAS